MYRLVAIWIDFIEELFKIIPVTEDNMLAYIQKMILQPSQLYVRKAWEVAVSYTHSAGVLYLLIVRLEVNLKS